MRLPAPDRSQATPSDIQRSRRPVFICIGLGFLLALFGTGYFFVGRFDASIAILGIVFAAALLLGLAAALLLKAPLPWTVCLAALGLTVLSFACQTLGPERRLVGTECQPLSECYPPVRGGGFPIQFVIDTPGITSPDRLGLEDEFHARAFVADGCFYACAILAIRLVVLNAFGRRRMQ